jgi:glycerophosphoryl diester phosphodiesterase
MSRTAWFDPPLPRILAHRGLSLTVPENSVDAFRAALDAGATHLETDVRATLDGAPVLVHDPELPDGTPVDRLTLAALRRRQPAACTVGEALAALPHARLNLDLKARTAVAPTVEAVRAAGALPRVLVTSFSGRRRRPAVRALPGVATSASGADVLAALLAHRARSPRAMALALGGLDALQVPPYALGVDLGAPPFLDAVHRAGAEVHFWVIDEPERMRALVAAGADGIVTDRPDLAAAALARPTER